ncbi:MAG TPA: DUF1150 family protein [Azospirillaceae bacterium]|nr:DUF1150 family protein [Azospirillaceae bacterium]
MTQNQTSQILRQLSAQDFAAFGVNEVAFVKPVLVNGTAAFAIHAANGQPLAVAPDLAVAFATVRQNDLEPVSLH